MLVEPVPGQRTLAAARSLIGDGDHIRTRAILDMYSLTQPLNPEF